MWSAAVGIAGVVLHEKLNQRRAELGLPLVPYTPYMPSSVCECQKSRDSYVTTEYQRSHSDNGRNLAMGILLGQAFNSSMFHSGFGGDWSGGGGSSGGAGASGSW